MHLSDELRLPTAGAGLLMECRGGLIVTCSQLHSEYRNRGDVNVVAHQPLKSERVRSHTTLETDEQINCFIPEPTKPTVAPLNQIIPPVLIGHLEPIVQL